MNQTNQFADQRSQGGVALEANAWETSYVIINEYGVLKMAGNESRWVKVGQGEFLSMCGMENDPAASRRGLRSGRKIGLIGFAGVVAGSAATRGKLSYRQRDF
jgi:hypothetical protein